MNDPGLLIGVDENKLNDQQKNGLELMKKGYNVFLTGIAGAGKSFTLMCFIKWCIEQNKVYAVTSTTGVSALLIGGTTLHSWAGILLGLEDKITLYERVLSRDKSYKKWLYTNVLIIDEISMMSSDLLEKLDYIGKKIRKNTRPFGGIQLVLVGDFAQLSIGNNYCFKSPIWELLIQKNIYLTENMRQSDPIFQNVLLEVRIGNPSENTIRLLESRIGAYIPTPEGIIPTKLYSHRAEVAKINHDNLMNLVTDKNPLQTYLAKDMAKKKDGTTVDERYKEQYLGSIDKIFQANKTLGLCVGAQVMLLYNMDLAAGLCNGSRGCVIRFENGFPVVRFMNGIEVPIGKHTWSMKIAENVVVSRTQIPLTLAWAITIHKAQGSTLDCAQLDLGSTLFSSSQGYAALSRVKSLDCVSIVTLDPSKIFTDPAVLEFYEKLSTKLNHQVNINLELDIDQELDNNEDIDDKKLCCICYEKEKDTVFVPCGHVACCLNCSYNVDICVICRSDITSRNKFYL